MVRFRWPLLVLSMLSCGGLLSAQSALPSGPLAMRDFRLQFDPAGTFSLSGQGWPPMAGSWKMNGTEITLVNQPGPAKCDTAARYTVSIDGARVGLVVVADDCQSRRMILDHSRWLPPGTATAAAARTIVRTAICKDATQPGHAECRRLAVVQGPRSLWRSGTTEPA